MSKEKETSYSSKPMVEALGDMLRQPKIVEGDEGKVESRDLREIVAAAKYLDTLGGAEVAGKKRCLFQKIRPDSAID